MEGECEVKGKLQFLVPSTGIAERDLIESATYGPMSWR